jgi:hypothetical protein
MIQGAFSTGLDMKSEKLCRSALTWQHPIVWLHDDEWKSIQDLGRSTE